MRKCPGCGSILQHESKELPGYIEKEDNNLCERCFKLKHYGNYKSVPLTNEDYKKILKKIPKTSFTLYITDILTLECPEINNFQNIILVITKKDILPKSVKAEKIINYMKKEYPNIKDIHVISSKTDEGIDNLYQKIKKYKKIYLVGATNSGKSTLINRLIKNNSNVQNEKEVTTSMYPSTTLNEIKIRLNDLTLIDTPGLINKNNITNYINSSDLKKITPKKEIKPKSCQIKEKGSILIDNYARIDYETKEKNSITIYASNALNIKFISQKNDILKDKRCSEFKIEEGQDIVIPGLCFLKCVHSMKIRIYTLKGVKPHIRKNLI